MNAKKTMLALLGTAALAWAATGAYAYPTYPSGYTRPACNEGTIVGVGTGAYNKMGSYVDTIRASDAPREGIYRKVTLKCTAPAAAPVLGGAITSGQTVTYFIHPDIDPQGLYAVALTGFVEGSTVTYSVGRTHVWLAELHLLP